MCSNLLIYAVIMMDVYGVQFATLEALFTIKVNSHLKWKWSGKLISILRHYLLYSEDHVPRRGGLR